MAVQIRQAITSDAQQWIELLRATLGEDYPDKRVYDPAWVFSQFSPESELETWVVDSNGRLNASISFLPPLTGSSLIANIGRNFFRPESFTDGSAGELLRKVTDLTNQRKQHCVVRVRAPDYVQQILFEKLGYACVGYQPFKHMNRLREGVLFYVRVARPELLARLPLSESLRQLRDLSSAVLTNLKLPHPISIQDGAIGYPLQAEVDVQDVEYKEYEESRQAATNGGGGAIEISGSFNVGYGFLRTDSKVVFRAVLASNQEKVTAGLAYTFDPLDRCVRLVRSFAVDDLSMGQVLRHVMRVAQEQFNAVYVEVDILVTAPRMLKTAEQLGFIPIAYLAEFFIHGAVYTDVVKMVKLNMVYSRDDARFTPSAQAIVEIIDRNFHDQKIGVAIINLLRGLKIFEGLGDGELRKIARLFTQKLFRANERIFNKGDSGKEAYIVMRGAVDILLEEGAKPLATIGIGQIFGELAFLDGASRVAMAVATEPTILLIVQRSAFNTLAQREPHLGMVVMRNIAMELSKRLRRANSNPAPAPK